MDKFEGIYVIYINTMMRYFERNPRELDSMSEQTLMEETIQSLSLYHVQPALLSSHHPIPAHIIFIENMATKNNDYN